MEVHAGRFGIEFTVPPIPESPAAGSSLFGQDPRSPLFGPGARVAAYAWTAGLDAKGGRDGVLLRGGADRDPSVAPPVITLAFPRNAIRVAAGTELTAEIEDENGIWIAGTTLASCILLQLDAGEPIDLTAAYRAMDGSDVSGKVTMALPALAPGPHHATVSASDNLGNPASASLEFEIVDAPAAFLSEFRAGPNPTCARADFTFLLDVPADIELRVFSVDGRQVFLARQHHDGLRRGLVQWNGKSTDGNRVASGVYLYRLEARPAGSAAQQCTGKLAVLR